MNRRTFTVLSAAVALSCPLLLQAEPTIVDSLLEREQLTGDWGGYRTTLEENGLTIDLSLQADLSKNLRGGLSTNGWNFAHLFTAGFTFDPQPLLGWQNATLFASFQTVNGDFPSVDVGDLQGISGNDSDGRTQISEIWVEQRLLDDMLALRLGKMDANDQFAVVETAEYFLNGAMPTTPSLFLLPTYPDPAFGASIFLRLGQEQQFHLGAGVYDGSLARGVRTGSRGPRRDYISRATAFLILETGLEWSATDQYLPGRGKVGVWHNTTDLERFDGSEQSGVTGGYLIVEQTLHRVSNDPDDARGLGMFLQYGITDPDVSEVKHHLGSGLAWTGPIVGRDSDVAGVGFTTVFLSNRAGFSARTETAIELFYRVQITPWFSVTPDLQYVINPGGDRDVRDALVGTLRLELSL